MKNKYVLGILTILILGLGILIGVFGNKKLGKPVAIVVHDTILLPTVDTVWHISIPPIPKPDTFYTQEVLYDSTIIDTAAIIADYIKTNVYNDTLISDEQILVTLKEKVSYNKISSRILSYKYKPQPINTVIEVPKKKLSLYMGGEVAVDAFGLTKASIGIGLKDKRDIFYTIDNNFVDGLKLNLGVGIYIPIIK